MRIRINNGHIIDPKNNIDDMGDICIAEGKIISSLENTADFSADKEIDASGKLVCPGLIDLCAHFREPGLEYKATILSESIAAASAGVTTVCCPPVTQPVIDTPAVVELINQRAEAVNKTRIYCLGALTHGLAGERLSEMHTLKQAGCVGVTNGYLPLANAEILRRAMEYAAGNDIRVFLYPEDHSLRNNGVAHEGPVSTRLGLPPIPQTAETVAVSQALLLAEQSGVALHFCRLSAAKSIAMVASAKQTGLPVTADVAISHLHLSENDVDNYNVNCHLQPPLRTSLDMQALRNGVAEGVIDVVCSDHQPHDDDAKSAPFSETEAGASTIELLFPLINELVNNNTITLKDAIASLTIKPARILGLELGSLSVGASADIAIFDAKQAWTVDKYKLLSAGKNTPFNGKKLTGKVTHTLLQGRIVYQQN